MSELSREEIDRIIDKIRSDYTELSQENPTLFNLYPFEQRYTQVLTHKGNVNRFIRDEILFLDQLKSKHNEMKRRKKASSEQTTIDKIIEENEARIRKYPKIDFHPMAKTEIKYFYGAIVDFVNHELQFIYKVFRGTPEMNILQEPVYALEKTGLTRKGKLSIRMNEHVNIIQDTRGTSSTIERECQTLLRETCRALKSVSDIIEECIDDQKVQVNNTIRFSESDSKELIDKFGGITYGEALKMIIEKTHNIIRDFRMDSLVGLDKKDHHRHK
ncbi:MAG: hypothetical protein H7A25_03650 [Leptospiraceae bacterium]|nr:hypothetical protein [Leptospiraceae bacterium]MCP5498970.1 hypothetical protein [Leptospiraceae bacterium]